MQITTYISLGFITFTKCYLSHLQNGGIYVFNLSNNFVKMGVKLQDVVNCHILFLVYYCHNLRFHFFKIKVKAKYFLLYLTRTQIKTHLIFKLTNGKT